jgi:hypothetical protein
LLLLTQIIRESLPPGVRAQKETIDLICYLSNGFIDLLADVANNVCYASAKKNIIVEHLVKAV